jgi:hypothetical protein
MLSCRGSGFNSAEETFFSVKGRLQSDADHAKAMHLVEDELRDQGREISRLLLEGYLKECGSGDIGLEVIAKGDLRLNHKRMMPRAIETLFGKVDFQRFAYSARGHAALYPLDAILNLPESSLSYPLQKLLVREAAKGAFSEALASVEYVSGVKLSKRKALDTIQHAASNFDGFYESAANLAIKDKASLPLLILTTDGKGVVMRPEGLREATLKRRENSKNKHKTRLSKGEKNNAKRMAQVASIYHIDRYIRRPKDVYDECFRERIKDRRPKPVAKRIWANIEKDASEVIESLVLEAKKRDSKFKKEWVVLIDGQDHQIQQIEAALIRHKVQATIVLDIVHVIEYLWKAAHQFYEEGSWECEQWVQDRLKQLLNEGGRKTAGSMRMSAAKRLPEVKQLIVEKSAHYISKRHQFTNYCLYLKKGYPIGTGVIEGACRYLVKDRMDITGARWGLAGAEAILRLRSILKSNDLDAYWEYHIRQEYQRVHRAQYGKLPSFLDFTS